TAPFFKKGGAYFANGALHKCAKLSIPAGACTNSSTDHSPHAVPVAKIPSGVKIASTANATHNGLVANPLRSFVRNNPGSKRCRYATTPPLSTISANPATVKCP